MPQWHQLCSFWPNFSSIPLSTVVQQWGWCLESWVRYFSCQMGATVGVCLSAHFIVLYLLPSGSWMFCRVNNFISQLYPFFMFWGSLITIQRWKNNIAHIIQWTLFLWSLRKSHWRCSDGAIFLTFVVYEMTQPALKNIAGAASFRLNRCPPLHETLHEFDTTSHLPWHNHFPLNCMIKSAPCFLHACKETNLHRINTLFCSLNYFPLSFPNFSFISFFTFFPPLILMLSAYSQHL